MADYYVDYDGNISSKKKKKKEKESQSRHDYSVDYNGKVTNNKSITEDEKDSALAWRDDEIAPVRDKSGYLQKSAFLDDGYQVFDGVKTAGATVGDVVENAAKGGANWLEKLWDGMLTFGTKMNESSMMQAAQNEMIYNAISGNKESASTTLERYTKAQDEVEKATAEYVAKDLIKEEKIDFGVDEYSVLGEKSDALVQSGAELLIRNGVKLIPGVGVPLAYMSTGLTSVGGEAENAFNQEATFDEAFKSGLISAGGEIGTELLFGGIKIGKSTITDGFVKKATSLIPSKFWGTLAKWGINTVGEGVEEDLSGYLSAIGQKMTYLDEKELDEIYTSEDHWENFLGGVILGGFFEGVNLGKAKVKNIDYITGLKNSDKQVIDKIYNDAVTEKEKVKDKKLTSKEKTEIFDGILERAKKGDISTDIIEEVLGGEDYKAYKDIADLSEGLTREFDELGNKEHPTLADQYKYSSLMNRVKESNAKKGEARAKLDKTMSPYLNNSLLAESYREVERRGQKFVADLTQYSGKQKAAVERAIKSGVLNNTNKSHALVDTLSRIEAEKGIVFDYTSNEKLKKSGFAIEGKTVNGFEKNGTVTLNVNSSKSWQSVVGHEITHVLEGTEAYKNLQTTLFEYAESKGELESRRTALTELYNGIEADIDKELTADLVGDYLFGDSDFVRGLTTDKTLFQKVYDEIKYLYRVATGKEKTQIEKVKEEFDKVWSEFSTEGINEQIAESSDVGTENVKFSIRKEEPPKKTIKGYKVFRVVDGKLYPPMVDNPSGNGTPVGVWLNADVGGLAYNKDGSVKLNTEGRFAVESSQGGSLSFRPGWHLGEYPDASQFGRMDTSHPLTEEELASYEGKTFKNKKTGNVYPMNLFPYNFVWAECDVAADHDYQLDAMSLGVNEKGSFVRSRAGLPYVPTDGYYKYRTNPDPNTAPWIISGAIKVNRILDDAEVAEICAQHGVTPQTREGYTNLKKKDGGSRAPGNAINLADFGLASGEVAPTDAATLAEIYNADDVAKKQSTTAMELLKTLPGYAKRKINFADAKIIEEFGMNNQDAEYYRNLAESTSDGYLMDDKLYSENNVKYSVSEDSNGNELSLAVQKRFANSKAVDENGNLKVLYHGTYNGEFYTFDKSKGSVEGDFGSGFYFTDSENDVTRNYEGGGPDFDNKVSRRAEQIADEEGIDYYEAEEMAENELFKGSNVHTVYLNIENPAIVGETYLLDYDSFAEEYDREDYDSDEDYEGDVEQLIADTIDEIIWDVDRNVDIYSTDGIAEVLWNAVNEGGIDIEQLKANINNLYLEDNNGNLVGNEVTRQIIESLGYDGIIDNTVSSKFNMNIDEGTTHYIVFKPNQIKSIENQNPTDNPDIRYSLTKDTLDNGGVLGYNGNRGEGYVRTDEFRNLQAESQRMSDKDIQLFRSGNKQIDAELRANLARILRTQIDTYRNGLRNDDGLLSLSNKGNEFNMCKSVDGTLFHDVFEIAQKYLRNGELVDLHKPETTDEHGIGYKYCNNYLSEDGLSGFSITPDGDLISVFNASGKKGFLGAIAPFVKENVKTLDCYNSPKQPLCEMYEAMFGFKTASIMDYNMVFDHDNIAENHNYPKVAFMVNTESDVETKAFTKDQYDEAVAHRNGFVMSENVAPVKNSLSYEGDQPSATGTPLQETAFAPVREDVVTTAPTVAENARVDTVGKTPTIPKSVRLADGSRGDELLNDSLDNYPMETVEQKVAEKIRAVEGEIADNKDLRREAEENYNNQIAKLQKKYGAKKDKSTKTASNILRSISRLERLKASADAEYAKRISDLEARAEKMKDPKYSRAKYKQAKMQEHAKWAENLLGDTSTWVDKKLGLQYSTNTERRNLRDIVRDANGNADIAKADAIDDALNGQYNREEAAKKRELAKIRGKYADLKINNAETAYIQMLGEFRHNPDTTLTEKAVKEFYEQHKGKIDTKKVDKVIDLARQDYDSVLERVNEKLREQGMKEIPYRKGYFLHYTDPKQNLIQKLLNWKTQDNEIPTSIAGLTEEFKPVKSWQAFDKRRYSDKTDYNFLKGFDSYLEGALDWVYHLDTLQKRRAVENHIRSTHSEEGIQKRIKEVYANEEFDADEAQAQIENILADGKNPLNNFVQDFTTHTNILAGKKNSLDRAVEQSTNRHIYSVMTNVQNRMSANMVLGNVRSALTNFIPITQSWAQVSPMRSLQATKDVIANAIKDDGVIDKSTFLTNRLKEPNRLYNTTWDKVLDKAGIMFEVVDNISSQVIWRSKYNQNLANGMTESQAIKNADQFAENVMAGRSKGNEPTLFNAKNPLVKAFTMFQLEVNNQYGYLLKDVPNDLKAETEHWKVNLAKGYATAFIGAYVYNALMEQVAGSGAALDPIGIIEGLLRDLGLFDDDEEKEPTEVATNLIENVGEELPFVGGVLFGGGRIPISSALPYGDNGLVEGIGDFIEDVGEGNWENIGKEMMNPILNVGLPVGGGQIKKTYQGLSMFNTDEEHPVAGSYTDSGALRFPVEDTVGNRIQAGIFGQYASENAREYFDNGYAPLKEKQIQEYVDVDLPIGDYWKYRDGLKGLKTNAEKADYINSLDIADWQKNLLMNNILDRKEDVDMSNYGDYGSWEEFDYASKNPDKYAFSKAVGGYKSYKTYSEELNDITADKDISGKSINGSRKAKVIDYINNLDADYATKIILYKSEYPSDDTYNKTIIEYLNNRQDLTYEERVYIFTELGFSVSNGYVYWD